MTAALGTLLFFAITPIFALRAASRVGSLYANAGRLMVAALVLGAWAYWFGRGFDGSAFWWFFLGGMVGFGIGGLGMFLSLPLLGSALSTLIVQCLSVIVAVAIEWWWLETRLTPEQLLFVILAVVGVAIGLLPRSLPRLPRAERFKGVAWAVLSAAGQGTGAVISRKAFAVARAAHEPIDPGTATFQRVLGGLLIALIAVTIIERWRRPPSGLNGAPPWILANALTGPVLGVTCYQWALRTTPAGIVQPIVAAAPLLTLALAAWLEGTRPRWTYYAGALLAVAGVAGLMVRT